MQGSPDLRTPVPDPEADLRRALTRQRAVATGLLAGMGGVLVGSYWLPPGYWTDVLQASANHVFTEAEVRRVLGRLDLAGILRNFLADPQAVRPAAAALAGMTPRVLASLEDGRARRLIARLIPRLAGGPGAARVLARALNALIEGGRHQEVFGLALGQLKVLLAAKEDQLHDAIASRVRTEGGALMGWIAGATIARRVLAALNHELDRVEPGDSDLRAAFETWLREQIRLLEEDPERAAAVGRAVRDALANPAVSAWLGDVWGRLRGALETDARNPSGRTVGVLEGALSNLGTVMAEDPAVRERLNRAAEGVLIALLPNARAQLADFIAGVVRGWDTATVTEKIELRVGKDLQYVRINGTLVGFLVGGALFALLTALFGRVAV